MENLREYLNRTAHRYLTNKDYVRRIITQMEVAAANGFYKLKTPVHNSQVEEVVEILITLGKITIDPYEIKESSNFTNLELSWDDEG